eukprot:Hpha_TRINITY_DN15165_c3_g17::TRINITY_DN15165_c3_g17_i1::g.126646::m.126646
MMSLEQLIAAARKLLATGSRKYLLIAGLVCAAVLGLRARAAAKRKRLAHRKPDGKKKERKPDPMKRMFGLLWPFQVSKEKLREDPQATVGRLELIVIFIVSVLRAWHVDRMVYVKRDLMMATYNRDMPLFRKVIIETAIMSILSSVIFAAHRFLKERLGLLWRDKLIGQLHRKYFHAMNYYKLSHLNESKISDVEERVVKDSRRFTKALADEMEKISAALTSGLWFTFKLASLTSLPYAISPFTYFFVCYKISVMVVPNWSKKWRQMLDLRAKYFGTQSRLQSHAEAICAYQGNDTERQIIDGAWHDFLGFCRTYVVDATLFQFISEALFKYGGHSFAETLIIGRFISPESEGKRKAAAYVANAADKAKAAVQANAIVFSELRFTTEYFIRCMTSQGTVIGVMRQLQSMQAPARRITELFDTLDMFEERRVADSTFRDHAENISFENVQVYTPTGNLLLKDLSFQIHAGMNMLLTGCNGSGKSSIFRCLGGLWSVPEGGVITKPGGNAPGLNSTVFYLPQKPYNVLGTLRQQLCYPVSIDNATNITDQELRELLSAVDLGYLVERGPQGPNDDKEVNWETVLSMGEKQRLAMARLFYHKPRFAILDECTSGVSASMEKRMYDTCAERGITCITISHRPVLERYHDAVLNVLKDDKGGWTWKETWANQYRMGKMTAPAKADEGTGYQEVGGVSDAYLASPKGDAMLEKRRLEKRSEKYRAEHDGRVAALNKEVTLMQRLKDVMFCGFMPNGLTLKDPEMRRVILLAALVIGKTVAADAIAMYDGYILSTVLQDDLGVFIKAVSKGALFRTSLALFEASISRQKWYLNLEWRRRLTEYLMNLYFTGTTFYDVKNQDERIPDPEERLTEQVETLSIALTDLWTSALKPAFDIAFNCVMLYKAVGPKAVIGVSSYMLGGSLLMRFLVPNFRANTRKQFRLEGRFRFVHTRLVEHTESIAFFGGDEVEREVCDHRWVELKQHIERSQLENLRFNIFNNFTIKQTPDIMAFALRMFFAYSNFTSDEAVLTRGKGDIARIGEYIQHTVMRTFTSFGEAFDLQETIGNFAGTLENVSDMMYVLQDISARSVAKTKGKGHLVASSADHIAFDGVDIVAPGGTCCTAGLTFRVSEGRPLVVTGPNGCGKSSLFRTLGGLWPIPSGRIERPVAQTGPFKDQVTPKEVFLLPAKPYSVRGNLADQITYPEKLSSRTPEQEARLFELLRLVRIEYLSTRDYNGKSGWDTVQKWEDVLSLGEQQRLGCARLFYHRPKFAVLDECTSAVSIDVEEDLYRFAAQQGITSITLSQRLALQQFHFQELRLGDAVSAQGWEVVDIEKKP